MDIVKVVGVFLVLFRISAAFPSDIERCQYGDGQCIIERINYLFESKSQGHSGIHMVSIDPLNVTSMTIKRGKAVSIVLKIRDSQVLGFNKLRAHKVTGFNEDLTGEHFVLLKVPVASLIGDYTINGKVLILPINGNGKTNFTITDVEIGLRFNGTPEKRNGEKNEFMVVNNLNLSLEISRLYMNFTNLFNGDPILGDNMNLFLNDNWADIYMELKDAMTQAFSSIYQSVINTVFSKYPYKSYFKN